MTFPFFQPRFLFRLAALFLVGAGLCYVVPAGRAKDEDAPSLTDDGHEAFSKLQPLLDAKDYDGAIAVLQKLITKVPADSFDRCLSEETMAKIYWQEKDSPQAALPHLELVEQMLGTHPEYFTDKERGEYLKFIAQAYFSVAMGAKEDKGDRVRNLDQCLFYLRRWLSASTPTADDEYLYATVLFNKANTDYDHPDVATMRQAAAATQKAIHLSYKTNDSYYRLLAYTSQATGNFTAAAEYLELLVQLKPLEKTYWSALVAAYSNIATGLDAEPARQRIAYARMINALERAQALHYMDSPRDNQLLVSLYNQVGQYGRATQLMEAGLSSGGIPDKFDNWIYLAQSYEEIGSNADALRVLKSTAERYPEKGEVDALIAEFYARQYNQLEVYNYAKRALQKGNISKHMALGLLQQLGYAAYELSKYDEALGAVRQALDMPGAPKKRLADFESGILNAIKQQQAVKAQTQ